MNIGTFTVQVETPDEPDHVACFPQTRVNLAGDDYACFELYGKKNRRQLKCTFDVGNREYRKFCGETVKNKVMVESSEEPKYCMLYVDKSTGIATLRPAILHTLTAEKSEYLDTLEQEIMHNEELNHTLKTDTRDLALKRAEFTGSHGSKLQKQMLKNSKLITEHESKKHTAGLVAAQIAKSTTEFTASEGQSRTVPPRHIDAIERAKIYVFAEMFSEEILGDLSGHAEEMRSIAKEDIDWVASYYGAICANLVSLDVFSRRMKEEGRHLDESQRDLAFSWLTVAMRLYSVFRIKEHRSEGRIARKQSNAVPADLIDKKLWEQFSTLGASVKTWMQSEFLNFNADKNEYLMPNYCADKLQAWILVVVLLLCNFETSFEPIQEFFVTQQSNFDRIVTVVGASMTDKEIKLKLPLQGLQSRGKRRGKQ